MAWKLTKLAQFELVLTNSSDDEEIKNLQEQKSKGEVINKQLENRDTSTQQSDFKGYM